MSTPKLKVSQQCNPDPRTHIIGRLKEEHEQLLRKLNLLELHYLDMCRGETPDCSLMKSILVYVQEYPEQIHHPLEDMIYAILLERVDDSESVRKLIPEHTKLETVTRELIQLLESCSECRASAEKLKQQLSEFLVGQRQHIYIEESEVFPLVQRALTDKDWKRLENMTPILDDPTSGGRTWYDYERLNREIEGKYQAGLPGGQNSSLHVAKTVRPQLV